MNTSVKGAFGLAALSSFPTIVPAHVLGKQAPSNMINVGIIGIGRMGAFSETNGVLKYPRARAIATCDVDSKRLNDSKKGLDNHYTRKNGKAYNGTKAYEDLRDSLRHHRKSWLDPYGATKPAEFFAVLTEAFFQQPAHLQAEQPDVYKALKGYYRLNPMDFKSGID